MSEDLFTGPEELLHALLGDLYGHFELITLNDETRARDLLVVEMHIHALQDMVCRNVAARVKPLKVRPLGGVFPPIGSAVADEPPQT